MTDNTLEKLEEIIQFRKNRDYFQQEKIAMPLKREDAMADMLFLLTKKAIPFFSALVGPVLVRTHATPEVELLTSMLEEDAELQDIVFASFQKNLRDLSNSTLNYQGSTFIEKTAQGMASKMVRAVVGDVFDAARAWERQEAFADFYQQRKLSPAEKRDLVLKACAEKITIS